MICLLFGHPCFVLPVALYNPLLLQQAKYDLVIKNLFVGLLG